jgi:diguanylate cyclase (GGDEF)-like protein
MMEVVILLVVLISINTMLASALLVAWQIFGRPAHAAIWALGSGVAALTWAAGLRFVLFDPGSLLHMVVLNGLGMLSFALFLIGLRQRAGRNTHQKWPLAAVLLVTFLVAIATFLVPHAGIRQAVPPLFGAVMSALAVPLVVRAKEGANLAERVLTGLLVASAVFMLGAAGLAAMQGANGDDYFLLLYRVIMLMLLPMIFGGTALFALLLLCTDATAELRRLAASDSLTGVLNRRGFDEAAVRAIANARRQGQPLAIVLSDIDRFKQINDRYGHAMGDLALRRFADEVVLAIRAGDVLARVGGEEFALLLVDTAAENAIDVVDRVRQNLAAMTLDSEEEIRLTASFGVAALEPQDVSPSDILERADKALYRSKLGGRDQVSLQRCDGTSMKPAAEIF